MTLQASSNSFVGEVRIITTDNRGFNAEEMADLTVDKIIFIGRNSHPAIIEQARAFKEQIRQVLVAAFTEAQQEEKKTICAQLDLQGQSGLADIIRRL
jgi:cephalosporin hydroxylase